MGTVVRFHPREADALAKTEAILTRIGDLYQQRIKAREVLPGVLASLVQAGETELALRALTLWGSGQMEPHDVLAMCEKTAAVVGIKEIGNRPF